MNDAIWDLIGNSVIMLAGILVGLSFILSMFVALLDGIRHDRWSVFKRLEGVMRGLQKDK